MGAYAITLADGRQIQVSADDPASAARQAHAGAAANPMPDAAPSGPVARSLGLGIPQRPGPPPPAAFNWTPPDPSLDYPGILGHIPSLRPGEGILAPAADP